MTSQVLNFEGAQRNKTVEVGGWKEGLKGHAHLVFDKIKAFVEPQITSLNNVTSDIVRTVVQPKLQSLSNMTSHMLQQQQNRTTQTFNSLIKARSPPSKIKHSQRILKETNHFYHFSS